MALPYENFEFGWNNDGGLLDDLDAVPTAAATPDTFESGWLLPAEWASPVDNGRSISSFDTSRDSAASAPFTVEVSVADVLAVDTIADGSEYAAGVLPAGSYADIAALIVVLQPVLDAMAFGLVAEESPGGRLRIRTSGVKAWRPRAATDSAWNNLGFPEFALVDQDWGFRFPVATTQEYGTFDVALDAFEDFEEEWRDNELSIFAFAGPELSAASFDVAIPEAVEDFEEEWTTTLEL